MKITNVSYERFDLSLSAPYTIAYETISKAVNFILKIETDDRIAGYGCAAPDPMVTKETPEAVEADIKDVIIPFLKGKDVLMSAELLSGLKPLLRQRSSALAMVDMALLDTAARKLGVPLYKYLGGYRHNIATSITLGILPLDETLRMARDLINEGFFILKIKGGLSLEEDIEKMKRLREKFPNIHLRFDGNQGYSVKEAITFLGKRKT